MTFSRICLGFAILLWLLFMAALVTAAPTESVPTNGSVVFWQGGILAKPIVKHTGSDITHAAIVIDGFVYEAVPPRVHRVLWNDYVKEMARKRNTTYFVMTPKQPYSKKAVDAMRKYLDSQLGRPYMLRGWWRGHEVLGIFCSQLVGNAIEKTGRIKSDNWHESPGALYKKLLPLYKK